MNDKTLVDLEGTDIARPSIPSGGIEGRDNVSFQAVEFVCTRPGTAAIAGIAEIHSLNWQRFDRMGLMARVAAKIKICHVIDQGIRSLRLRQSDPAGMPPEETGTKTSEQPSYAQREEQ